MRVLISAFALIGLCLLGTSCVSYSGVSRTPEGQIYISGATNYFFFSKAWVRRCNEDGMRLDCIELSESPSTPRGGSSGGSPQTLPATMGASPSSSASAPAGSGSAAPAEPAPGTPSPPAP